MSKSNRCETETLEAGFQFPSADLVHAAAGLFPPAWSATSSQSWMPVLEHRPLGDPGRIATPEWARSGMSSSLYPTVGRPHPEWKQIAGYRESGHKQWTEGIFAHLTIGPGVMQLRRRNDAAADRAIARAQVRARVSAEDSTYWVRPLTEGAAWLEDLDRGSWDSVLEALPRPYTKAQAEAIVAASSARGAVVSWSAKSHNNLRLVISQLDLAPLVESGRPLMFTVTLPGNWEIVTPSSKAASKIWNRFLSAWDKEFEGRMAGIWKREFQKRGAPHWHIWTVLPAEPLDWPMALDWEDGFRRIVADVWTRSLHLMCDGSCAAPAGILCDGCEDYRKSRGAGTRVDMTEGARARDPRRLATYFLKESAGTSGKEYQNQAPELWAGQSVGRFWGVCGIKKAVAVLDCDPRHADKVWRVLRGVRMAQRSRWGKRVRVRGAGGFVLVHDGPAFASQLARFVEGLDPDRFEDDPATAWSRSGATAGNREEYFRRDREAAFDHELTELLGLEAVRAPAG